MATGHLKDTVLHTGEVGLEGEVRAAEVPEGADAPSPATLPLGLPVRSPAAWGWWRGEDRWPSQR